jgi:transketolase
LTPTSDQLSELARIARVDAVKELWAAQSGHPGSSLSAMDVWVALYFANILRHRPAEPTWEERDVFILSNGHAAPGLYACLALAGYFDRAELDTLRKLGSRLEGHVKRGALPGIECSAGSLGQGLGFGAGIAMGMRWKHTDADRHVFVMMSDGEQQEGSTWEAIMFIGSNRLAHLTAIVDVNRNQINGPTHEIQPIMDELKSKYNSFGWKTLEIDGNDFRHLPAALADARQSEVPTVIISHTTTGKGVPFMEGDFHWHHGVVTDALFREAMAALGEEVSPTPDETWAPGTTPLPGWARELVAGGR